METNNENKTPKEEMIKRSGLDTILIICLFAAILIIIISIYTNKQEQGLTISNTDNSRFEVEVQEKLSSDVPVYMYVVTDRETDVQYLITYSSSGMGVTTMRDTNGMVLLRE